MFGKAHTYTQEQQLEKMNRSLHMSALDPSQVNRMDLLLACARTLGVNIIEHTPSSREQSLAMTKLQEALFWCHEAIRLED